MGTSRERERDEVQGSPESQQPSPAEGRHIATNFLVSVSSYADDGRSVAPAIDIPDPYGRSHSGRIEEFVIGSLRIAYQLPQSAKACNIIVKTGDKSSGAAFALVLGWCYRVDGTKPYIDSGDCEAMIDRLRQGLLPLDGGYAGNYVAILYDQSQGRLVVQPDRWAMSGVFYHISEAGLVVSNRPAAIARLVAPAIDGHALLAQMRGTFLPLGRSLFAGIHRLMCGCHLSGDLKGGGFSVTRDQPLYDSIEAHSRSQSIDQLQQAFETMGVRLRAMEGTLFDLSGGHDTRLIAAGALRRDGDNGNFFARVFGASDDPDAVVAQEIAAAVNCPLIRCDRPHLEEASRHALGDLAVFSGGGLPFDEFYKRLQAEKAHIDSHDWLVGGIGGEFLRGFFWTHEFLQKGRSSEVNYRALLDYRLYARRDVDLGLFGKSPAFYEESDQAILSPFEQIGNAGGSLLNVYKLDALYMHRLCYKVGDYHSLLLGLRNVIYPFLTSDLARAILTIPWALRADRRLVLETIARLNPTLSQISNADGEPMELIGPSTLHRYAYAKLARMRRVVPRVLGRQLGQHGGSCKPTEGRHSPWAALLREPRHIDQLIDVARLQHLRQSLAEGHEDSAERSFCALLMLDLLMDQIPVIRKEIVFEDGPPMQP